MNKYTYTFTAICPVNRRSIIYTFTLETKANEVVYVEEIIAACGRLETVLHEKLADALFRHFGGRQILKAHHHGVDIETVRDARADEHHPFP